MAPRLVPVAHGTVVEVLRAAAQINGDVEAYVEPVGEDPGRERRSLTYGEWDRRADAAASYLIDHGVAKGDVVSLLLPPCIDFAIWYAATTRAGAITSAVNPRLGAAELESVMDRSRPVLTVVDAALGVNLPVSAGRQVERRALDTLGDDAPRHLPPLTEDDPVAVVWTSGTSGRPKGAVFDHRGLAAVAAGSDVLSALGDRRLSPLPMAHVGSMTRAWDEMVHAITTVIAPTPWSAGDALAVVTAERITVMQGVPTQWALMLEHPRFDQTDFSNLRIASSGAARLTSDQVREMQRRLGVPVVVRYTSTETSLGTGTRPEDAVEVVATTVGRPVPGVELMVVDEDMGPVALGTVGRVRLRSAAVMRGYWLDRERQTPGVGTEGLLDREATAGVLDDEGWVTTGDFGSLDDQGNLRLAGRANELYIRGGYNVYPAEVEEVISTHPAVGRCAIVGAPDDVLGEVGVAFVVAADGEAVPTLAEIRDWSGRRLADYKAPDALVVLESLPLTPMMKIDKRALDEQAGRAAEQRAAEQRRRRPKAV